MSNEVKIEIGKNYGTNKKPKVVKDKLISVDGKTFYLVETKDGKQWYPEETTIEILGITPEENNGNNGGEEGGEEGGEGNPGATPPRKPR